MPAELLLILFAFLIGVIVASGLVLLLIVAATLIRERNEKRERRERRDELRARRRANRNSADCSGPTYHPTPERMVKVR